jgi:putative oxidoreductase
MHISFLRKNSDLAFLILRIFVAAIFIFHGHLKWETWTNPGTLPPTLLTIMRFLSIAEPIAGVTIILGFCTQIAAIGLSVVMICAIYTKISLFGAGFSGTNGWELDLAILAGTFVLATHGAGKYALDAVLDKKLL